MCASLAGGPSHVLAGALELVGGALIIAGLLTRPVAFVLAGEMVVAYFMAHAPKAAWPVQNGDEPALLFALIFVFLAGNGAGRLSLDAWWRRRRSETATTELRTRRAA